ncbi:hypothetical protein [Mycetocola miduiensis]|uniref:hypothetical protein n=1 Tax=Mycetocola miduiensis TaxID=995034 RepID=UPI001FE6A240|nr:hypothetical protein [Mycetocola miduiensis]
MTIGTFGDITTRVMPSGRFEARTRYRDWDGRARQVQATGATAKAAEGALKAKLAERSLFRPADTSLTPDSLFADLVAYWLNDIDLEGRISKTTRNLYERNMRTLVSPAFDSLTLREMCGPVRSVHQTAGEALLQPRQAGPGGVAARLGTGGAA